MNEDYDFVPWCHEMDELFSMGAIGGDGSNIMWGNTTLRDLDNETLRALFALVRMPGAAASFPHIAQAYFDVQWAIMAECEKRGIALYPLIRIVVDNSRPKRIQSAPHDGPMEA